MAEQGGGGGLKKEVAGQPLWLWLAAGGVVLLGYWYFTHRSSSSSGSGSAGTGAGSGGTAKSSDNINETIKDWQGGGGSTSSTGPERAWLEHKTGDSRHPWTYLARHHESVKVGPHGSHKIVKDK